MTTEQTAVPLARDQYAKPLVVALGSGCAVAVALGVYGRLHHPTHYALDVAGFSSPLYAKAWLTTAAAVFAVVQLVTGYRITRGAAAAWMPAVHRWSGRIAILLTVPVIVHCLYALGFQDLLGPRAGALGARLHFLRRVRGEDAQPGPA